jgi:hypothetical protein
LDSRHQFLNLADDFQDNAMNDHIFLYWDDLGDSQEHVDQQIIRVNQCQMHALQQEWEENEEKWNARMDIIGRNGNEGTHYELLTED